MATKLTTKQRQAILLFYQTITDAKQTFNENTGRGKTLDYLSWLQYYEAKGAAKDELSLRVPRLYLVTDFWHHAYYSSLEDALEKAWTMKDEADSLKQGDFYEETKPKKKKGKNQKARAVSRVV